MECTLVKLIKNGCMPSNVYGQELLEKVNRKIESQLTAQSFLRLRKPGQLYKSFPILKAESNDSIGSRCIKSTHLLRPVCTHVKYSPVYLIRYICTHHCRMEQLF